ncbi:MAG: sigma-70 family RNA polymerase sigma factor [Chloroflexota bacterium]|nr:sigma-70 family RNA polymerase sigma factor [Chloroflexota bacterium]
MQQERVLLDDSLGAELYQRYAPRIFAYLCRQIASREDAEDLLVEVFLAVLEREHFSSLSEKEQQAWIWSVARNKLIDHYRRFSRHPSVSLIQMAEVIYEDEDLAPEQVILKQEEYARLHTALHDLPESQQEVLRLRFGHGLSCIEIAAVLEKNIPGGGQERCAIRQRTAAPAVRVRCHHGRGTLAACLWI